MSKTELYAFMLGIQIEEAGMSTDDFTNAVMEKFDVSHDAGISESEFVQGLCKWLDEVTESTANGVAQGQSSSTASSKTTRNKSQVRHEFQFFWKLWLLPRCDYKTKVF